MRPEVQGQHHDEEEEALSTPTEALQQAIDAGALSEVLQLLKRGARRVASSSSRAIDHFEFVEAEAGYRDAGAPLAQLLRAQDLAQILASTLEAMVRIGHRRDDVSHQLQAYFATHTELAPLVRRELQSATAVQWLVAAAPAQMLMSFEAMWALARSLTVRPRLDDETITQLALGIPTIKKSKRAAMVPLVHALASSTHPKATNVLTALHEAGVSLDAKWHGMRPLERAWAAGASQTVALLTKLNKPAHAEPKLPKPARKQPRAEPKRATKSSSWRDLKNPLAKVHIGLAFVFAWLVSWTAHAFGLPLLGATLPMIFYVLYRLDPRRLQWPRNPRAQHAVFQEAGLTLAACILINIVQRGLGSAASVLVLALAFGSSYIAMRLEEPPR